MNNHYYLCILTSMLAELPVVEHIANNSCPTIWLDGTLCEPIYHLHNIAFCIAEEITYELCFY